MDMHTQNRINVDGTYLVANDIRLGQEDEYNEFVKRRRKRDAVSSAEERYHPQSHQKKPGPENMYFRYIVASLLTAYATGALYYLGNEQVKMRDVLFN